MENKKVSIIIPVYNVNKSRFKKTLKSVFSQSYQNWELCISDSSKSNKKIDNVINEYPKYKDKIKYLYSEKSLGISLNTNNALSLATGDIIALLDHDDILESTALEEVVKAFTKYSCDVVYTDEQIISENGKIINRFFKPDFSPDLLYSQNYICHFLAFKKEILDKIELFNPEFDGAQDYDFILRMYEVTDKFQHINKILYNWLSTEESTSTNADSKPYAQTAGLKALDAHLKRIYGSVAHAAETDYLFVYEAKFDFLTNQKVGIIIPMKDKIDLTYQCVYSIIKNTSYQNYEILILDNNSKDDLTKIWLNDIKSFDNRIKVMKADMDFNWSKLQNFGMQNLDADCYVFLNNDTVVVKGNWLDILCSNALREEVGVVGPLLTYEDNTIQHAGVVVGLGGYAEHVFKGQHLVHAGINFISPMVARNVTAVTGACLVISKATLDKIGIFNENFIICGSDIELCLRAYQAGLRNIYTPQTMLKHLESKSRSTFIPTVDFKMSEKYYKDYLENGDPFFNTNLSLYATQPISKEDFNKFYPKSTKGLKYLIKRIMLSILNFVRALPIIGKSLSKLKWKLKKNATFVRFYRKLRGIGTPINETFVNNHFCIDYRVPESNKKIISREASLDQKLRINILIPSLNKDKVFGGIATAMKFFNGFGGDEIAKRIIVTDTNVKPEDLEPYPNYSIVDCKENSKKRYQVVDIHDSDNCELEVSENDIFIATAWWTAHIIRSVLEWQKNTYQQEYKKTLYFIQDYEPYFYPWGSRYALAESTYRMDIPTIAIFNSSELRDYMLNKGYKFSDTYYFEPILNDALKNYLLENKTPYTRKKRIICYGRPSVARNAFEVICEALILAFSDRNDANDWELVSMGEEHYDVHIKDKLLLQSVGKLTLNSYAQMMLESYMGISLMISPHPSYPPLEMSTFGVKTITNAYENKQLSSFNKNIISVSYCDPYIIAQEIKKLLDNYSEHGEIILNEEYIESSNQLEPIINDILANLK